MHISQLNPGARPRGWLLLWSEVAGSFDLVPLVLLTVPSFALLFAWRLDLARELQLLHGPTIRTNVT
jgi:hypothetical protein